MSNAHRGGPRWPRRDLQPCQCVDPLKSSPENFAILAGQLADCDNHWSLGTFGALAEFTRDAGEPVAITQDDDAVAAVTARGGIRLTRYPNLRLVASETATRASWNHRVALCLPRDQSAMNRRSVLTEIGADDGALRVQDRSAILFDLGLDAWQVDACIRVADTAVASELRAHVGRSVFDHDNPAMGVIVSTSPHRAFLSRVGRIEVFQPIPPPHGKSPEGPHTHVLPKLLQHRRTHAATEPIPEDLVPCAHLYPAHPVKDGLGRPLDFDVTRHESFQLVLAQFGDPQVVALKREVVAALERDRNPAEIRLPNDRMARACVRVALRQYQASRRSSRALTAWLQAHDRVHDASEDSPDLHSQD